MPFNPSNLGGQNKNGAQLGQQPAATQQDVTNKDIDIGLNEQIFVEGATADIYNRDEMFDRDRMISLASVEFDRIEYENLVDLFNAKIFEHKLDRTIIQEVYSRADLKNIGAPLEKLDEEIAFARNRLAAAKVLHQIIKNSERSFIDPERIKSVQRIFSTLTRERNENSLVKIPDELEYDIIQIIHSLTNIPPHIIGSLPPSYLYMQLLEDMKQFFVEGGHAGLFLNPLQLRNDDFFISKVLNGKLSKLWKLYNLEDGRKPLFHTGLQKNNTGVDFVFNSRWNNRIPNKKLCPTILRVAQICSSLATEYRVSAGLGLVSGNKTAIKYGLSSSKQFPFHNMIGGKNIETVSQNDSIKGSLQDLTIVSKTGNLQGGATKVALFDGYVNTQKTGTGYTDVRTAFIEDMKDNPANNNIHHFDKIIASAQQIFSETSTLVEDVTCANQDLNLLTPQGLFVRVLEEFCKLINYQGFEGDEVARAEQLAGIHLLGQTKGTYSDHVNSWSGILKYRLNTYVQRLIARRRDGAGVVLDKQVRLSSLELSKSFNASLEEIAFDRRLVAETLTAFSQNVEDYGSTAAGISKKSGILYDPVKLKNRFKEDIFKNHTLNKKFNNVAILSGEDFLDVNRDIDGSEGFLRGVADIFEEMEKEAMTAAGDSSYVNINRLTNLNGLDAALTTAMILECFCLLADSFTRTHFMLGVKSGAETKPIPEGSLTLHGADVEGKKDDILLVATSDEEGDGLTDISFAQFSDYVTSLRSIKHTEKANEHIFGGTASDEFISAFGATATGAALKNYHHHAQHAINWLNDEEGGKLYKPHASAKAAMDWLSDHEKQILGTDNIMQAGGYHGNSLDQAANIIKDFNSPQAFVKHVATKLRNRGASQFSVGRHILLYETGAGDGRQTLLEIAAAAKDGDLSQLFGDQNQRAATFLANENRVPYHDSMAKHDPNMTPSLVVDTINQLAISHVAPTRLFDVCRAMFIHLDESTADLSRSAAALRASNPSNIVHRGTKIQDPNDQMKALVSLAKTKAGRRLIKGFSSRQLEIVESRLQALESTDENQGYIVEFLNEAVEQAVRMYLETLRKNSERGKFVFYGLPAGKLDRLIYNKNAEKIDEEGYDSSTFSSFFDESFEDAEFVISVHAMDELQPHIKYKKAKFNFPLNITIDDAGIAEAFAGEEQPKTFSELVRFSEFTLDSPFTAEVVKASGLSLLPKYGQAALRNVVKSFLIKKLSEITFSMDVSEKETVATDPLAFSKLEDRDRSSSATVLMKDLAAVFLPDPKLVTKLFDAKPDLKSPTSDSLKKYTISFAANPDLPNSQNAPSRDLLLSLFNTKPFFANSIENYISRPSEFDYVFAVFVDQDDISVDEFKTNKTPEGKTALDIRKQSGGNLFSLKTLHSSAIIRNRKTGEILDN